MIYIKQYDVVLRTIKADDLDKIRLWRNDEKVQKNMFFQNMISAEEQIEWYKKLNKRNNLYFIYNKQGIIHLKDIDWINKEAEAGIFTVNQENVSINMAAIITLMDFAFDVLMLNLLKAKVKKSSLENINMNIQLGYRIISDENNCIIMVCKKSEYKIKESVRNWFEKTSKSNSELTIEISKESNWIKEHIHPSYLR